MVFMIVIKIKNIKNREKIKKNLLSSRNNSIIFYIKLSSKMKYNFLNNTICNLYLTKVISFLNISDDNFILIKSNLIKIIY